MKLYGIPNCNTVKKAREWLAKHHVDYEFHDFKKLGLDRETAQQWLAQYPWETLVNRAGMTWRNLPPSEKAAVNDADSALPVMLAHTSLVKRPVVVQNGRIIALGFNETEYTQLFQK